MTSHKRLVYNYRVNKYILGDTSLYITDDVVKQSILVPEGFNIDPKIYLQCIEKIINTIGCLVVYGYVKRLGYEFKKKTKLNKHLDHTPIVMFLVPTHNYNYWYTIIKPNNLDEYCSLLQLAFKQHNLLSMKRNEYLIRTIKITNTSSKRNLLSKVKKNSWGSTSFIRKSK